jgi:hypothetical protein
VIKRAHQWLFQTTDLKLELGRERSAVISLLQSHTRAPGVRTLFYTGLVGRVDERKIRLRYKVAWRHNDYAQVFSGCFRVEAGRTYLVGRFAPRRWGQIFIGMWAGFIVLWWIAAIAMSVNLPEIRFPLPMVLLVPPVMLAFGFGTLRLSQWQAKASNEFLESEIRETAGSPAIDNIASQH